MKEQDVVVNKVKELMETLDQVKKYNEFAVAVKRFALIVLGSITTFLILRTLMTHSGLVEFIGKTGFFALSGALVLILVGGLTGGVWFVNKRLGSIHTGEWKERLLNEGFPGALQLLYELDWQKSLEEISRGKRSYIVYLLIKFTAYYVITLVAVLLVWNILLMPAHNNNNIQIPIQRLISIAISFLIVAIALGRDVISRYREILALDMLFHELQVFSVEFGRAKFPQA